jgi:hypothetical protein
MQLLFCCLAVGGAVALLIYFFMRGNWKGSREDAVTQVAWYCSILKAIVNRYKLGILTFNPMLIALIFEGGLAWSRIPSSLLGHNTSTGALQCCSRFGLGLASCDCW